MEDVRCPKCGGLSHPAVISKENPDWVKYACNNKARCGEIFVWDTKKKRYV